MQFDNVSDTSIEKCILILLTCMEELPYICLHVRFSIVIYDSVDDSHVALKPYLRDLKQSVEGNIKLWNKNITQPNSATIIKRFIIMQMPNSSSNQNDLKQYIKQEPTKRQHDALIKSRHDACL